MVMTTGIPLAPPVVQPTKLKAKTRGHVITTTYNEREMRRRSSYFLIGRRKYAGRDDGLWGYGSRSPRTVASDIWTIDDVHTSCNLT